MIDRLQHLVQRLRAALGHARRDQEFELELSAHLEMAVEENLDKGMALDEARRQALIRLGGEQQARERQREARGLPSFDSFLQDLRYAVRGLMKSPGFTSSAVLTLALGIAVNATMFSMVSGFLLQPPPGRHPERVAVITSVNPGRTFLADTDPVSAPNYLSWRKGNDVFEAMAAADEYRTANLNAQGHSVAVNSAAVSPNYFSVLDVSAHLGRLFYEGDDQPGRDHVVVLSHALWDREFGSDSSLIGRTIRLNREDYTVIGILPAGFRMLGFVPELWTPLVVSATNETAEAHKDRTLLLFARLKPAVTLEQVRAEMATLGRRTEADFPATEKGWRVAAHTLPDFLIYAFAVRSALAVGMTVVGFVLLIACANVAGLLLARGGARRKELAIRMSLGASRRRIIRQLLNEGFMIALAGGSAGLFLAYWGIAFLRSGLSSNDLMRSVPLTLDRNVLFFALSVSILSAMLSSLVPAIQASRTDINSNLKDETRTVSAGRSQSRLRSLLVTAEITLALVLLIGTGLLLRAISLVEHQSLGFQADHLLTANVTLDKARYKDGAQQSLFVQNLLPQLLRLPGTEMVAATSDLPASGANNVALKIRGRQEPEDDQRLVARKIVVTPDFFRAAGIPVLRGHTFTDADDARAPHVLVVNQQFVHRYFNDQEPLANHILLDAGGADWSEIVGVVGDVKTYSEDTRDDPAVYESFSQHPVPSFSLMIRTHEDPNGLASALRTTVAQADIELPLSQLMSMSALIESHRGGTPLFTHLLVMFALLALVLSAIGIYGLISYSVGQRTHEIAIRMALGALGRDVGRMVMWQGVKMAVVGSAIGLVLALPLPRVFSAMLDGDLKIGEPRIYFVVMAAIFAVTTLATYLPARRASRIDPMKALHSN